MRKFLAIIMMLVMLTPSLACAMPICADEAQAAAMEQPCAGHESHHNSGKQEPIGEVSLLKDCMGADLQVAGDVTLVKAPVFKNEIPFDASLAAHVEEIWLASKVIGIRGPPPDWPEPSQGQPSIILTTQRFRI